MKKWQIILIIVVVAVILLASLFPLFAFNFLFKKPSRSTKVPKSYMEKPLYKASLEGVTYMKTTENVEDFYINSRDGLKLHGYFYPAPAAEDKSKPMKVVIGVHGYKSYSRPQFGPYIDFYHKMGYSLLAVDDRAHAPSEGKYIGFGVLDRLDCVDWAKYIADKFGPETEILLHGVSMGAATVLAASGEADLPSQVKGIISDCGFMKARDILEYQMGGMRFIIPAVEKIAEEKAGFNFQDYAPIDQVKKAKVPILFVQGGKDEMVPPFMVHELYDACPTEKSLLFVEEAGHGESIAFAKDKYENAIIELFGLKND